jgi:hypothetical protein
MPVMFECGCGFSKKVNSQLAGKAALCPRCKQKSTVGVDEIEIEPAMPPPEASVYPTESMVSDIVDSANGEQPPIAELVSVQVRKPVSAAQFAAQWSPQYDADVDVVKDVDGEDRTAFAHVPDPSPAPVPAQVPVRCAGDIPPEPWYYRFVAGYAAFIAFLGMLQFGILLFVFLIYSASPGSVPEGHSFGEPLIIPAIYSIAFLIGTLAASAPVLVAVDAARNIRAMRYQDRVTR